MASGKIRIGHYVLGETLGVGSFGKVKLAEHALTGQKVAMKIINKKRLTSPDMMARVKREIHYLTLLKHPHIIKLYEVMNTPTDIIMVIEYAGGELFEYIVSRGRLTEAEARRFFQQIICAVSYCHERHNIAHRDIKPENLLLDPYDNVKVADFGLSNLTSDGSFLRTSCGSPNYAAPEVISGKLYAGPEVDVWSCGVVLYVMLVGRLPFDDDFIPNLFRKINEGVFTLPHFLSDSAKSLVSSMLVVDPLKRTTMPDIIRHEWFQKDLPEYLCALTNCNNEEQREVIDDAAVDDLAKRCRLPRLQILQALESPDMSPIKVAYNLVSDHRKMIAYSKMPLESRQQRQDLYGSPHSWSATAGPSNAKPILTDEISEPFSPPLPSSIVVLSSSMHRPDMSQPPPASSATKKHKRRSKWHFGIRSRGPPKQIMHEIYRALRNVDLEWKALDLFHARVRHVQEGQVVAKFEVQLYKVDHTDHFVVDFRNVMESRDGLSTFDFFDVCSKVMFELSISD